MSIQEVTALGRSAKRGQLPVTEIGRMPSAISHEVGKRSCVVRELGSGEACRNRVGHAVRGAVQTGEGGGQCGSRGWGGRVEPAELDRALLQSLSRRHVQVPGQPVPGSLTADYDQQNVQLLARAVTLKRLRKRSAWKQQTCRADRCPCDDLPTCEQGVVRRLSGRIRQTLLHQLGPSLQRKHQRGQLKTQRRKDGPSW